MVNKQPSTDTLIYRDSVRLQSCGSKISVVKPSFTGTGHFDSIPLTNRGLLQEIVQSESWKTSVRELLDSAKPNQA
jgi:hypothetical protein